MKTYKIKFKGRKLYAIGIEQTFTEEVKGENFKSANLKLYDNYEHIRIISVNGKKYNPLETIS